MPMLLTPYIDYDLHCSTFVGSKQHVRISGVDSYHRFLELRHEASTRSVPTDREGVWYSAQDYSLFTKFKEALPNGLRHEHMSWRSSFKLYNRETEPLCAKPRLWLVEASSGRSIHRTESLSGGALDSLSSVEPAAAEQLPQEFPVAPLAVIRELPTDLQEQAMSKYRQLSKRRFALENTCRNSLDARIDLALKSAAKDTGVLILPRDCLVLIAQFMDMRHHMSIWDVRDTNEQHLALTRRSSFLLVCRSWFMVVTHSVQKWIGAPDSYWISHLPQLTCIDASRIVEFDFSMLPLTVSTPWIEHLRLSRCPITGVEVSQLSCAPQLQSLDLSHSLLQDNGLHRIVMKATKLKNLNLDGCSQVGTGALEGLRQLPELRTLCVRGCNQLTDASLAIMLPPLQRLTTLDLSRCTRATEQSLFSLGKLERLTDLSLSGCCRIAVPLLQVLETLTPRLSRLDLSRCDGITVGSEPPSHVSQQLTSLNLSGCVSLRGDVCHALQAIAPGIEELSLQGCSKLDLSPPHLSSLRSLCVASLPGVNDQLVMQLCALSLATLDLSKCGNVTAHSLHSLLGCSTLRSVDLSRNTQIAKEDLDEFRILAAQRQMEVTSDTLYFEVGT